MEIRGYTPEYKEQVRRICLETAGASGAPEKRKHYLLTMYCDHYLEKETAFLLLNEKQEAKGYVLCARDCRSYTREMMPKIKALPFPYRLLGKGDLTLCAAFQKDYPAHLHIDILEPYTGKGQGTALMNALLRYLEEEKIPGVLLNVAANNSRAIAFYGKQGFRVLKKTPFVLTMGRNLSHE